MARLATQGSVLLFLLGASALAGLAAEELPSIQPRSQDGRALPVLTTFRMEVAIPGVPGSNSSTRYHYDARGNLLEKVRESGQDDGVVDNRSTLTRAYDDRSNLIHELDERDFGADGDLDFIAERFLTYDD